MARLLAQITNPVINEKWGNLKKFDDPLASIIVTLWKALVLVGAIFTILYLLLGALEWLTSQGEKERLTSAKAKMTHAFTGMALLAASVAIVYLIDKLGIFGFSLLKLEWPTP